MVHVNCDRLWRTEATSNNKQSNSCSRNASRKNSCVCHFFPEYVYINNNKVNTLYLKFTLKSFSCQSVTTCIKFVKQARQKQ